MPDIRFEEVVGEIESAGRKAEKGRAHARAIEAGRVDELVRQALAQEAWRAERLSAD
jgi:hypothetical protein